jgi:hypothetical protein
MVVERNGGNAAAAAAGFEKLSESMVELQKNGSSSILTPLLRMSAESGVKFNLKAPIEEQKLEIAEMLKKLSDTQGPQVANWWGKQIGLGQDEIDAMRHGRKWMEEQLASAKKFAPSDESIKRANELWRSIETLKQAATDFGREITTQVTPAITEIIAKMVAWYEKNKDWLTTEISAKIKQFGDFLKAIDWDKAVGGFDSIAKSVGALAEDLGKAFTAIKNLFDYLKSIDEESKSWWITKFLNGMVGGAQDAGKAMHDGAQSWPEDEAHDRSIGHLDSKARRAWNWLTGNGGGGSSGGGGASTRDAARRGHGEAEGSMKDGGEKQTFAGKTFNEKAPGVMNRLMKDFNLSKEEAAVVLGNLGHESAGFTAFKEGNNGPGRGWAQWTDRGRKARFFQYAKENGFDPKSDEANYGFLKWELEHTHKNAIEGLKSAKTFDEKMRVFEQAFEGAGIKNYANRNRYARMAVAAWDREQAEKRGGAIAAPAQPPAQPPSSDSAARRRAHGDTSADLDKLSAQPPKAAAARKSWSPDLPPPGTHGMAGLRAASRAQGVANDNRSSTSNDNRQVHIGEVNVHTQATDAGGIAGDMSGAIERHTFATQANFGLR